MYFFLWEDFFSSKKMLWPYTLIEVSCTKLDLLGITFKFLVIFNIIRKKYEQLLKYNFKIIIKIIIFYNH